VTLVPAEQAKLKVFMRVNKYKVMKLAVFVLCFIAMQRHLLSPINTYICLLTAMMACVYFLKGALSTSVSLVLLSLFQISDMTLGITAVTPSVIKYCIYVVALGLLLSNFNLYFRPKLLLVFILCATLFSVSWAVVPVFSNTSFFSVSGAITTTFFLALIVVCINQKDDKRYEIDNQLMFFGLVGALLSEAINILFFHDVSVHQYLSLSSTKAFIGYVLIASASVRAGIVVNILLGVGLLIVTVYFGSRLALLLGIVFLGVFIIVKGFRSLKSSWWLGILGLGSLSFAALNIDGLDGLRSVSFLDSSLYTSNLATALYILDPIRVSEMWLFFSQPLYSILLGNGLGSGIYDTHSYLSFVVGEDNAFTPLELKTSIYYNLHDVVLEYSKDLGLVFVLGTVVGSLRSVYKRHGPAFALGFLYFGLNIAWSIPGMLICSVLLISITQKWNVQSNGVHANLP
jgi:hypothetical protein